MICTLTPFRALIAALESLGRAKEPTPELLHRACSTFVAMVAHMTGERVSISIGQTVIAREHERLAQQSSRRRLPTDHGVMA